MALIKCPECGKRDVSDSATTCPNCGYGIREHIEATRKLNEFTAQPTSNAQNGSHSVLGFIALVLIVLSLFSMCSTSGSSSSRSEVRCWYCSRVIYNNGRPIHCKQKYSTTTTSWVCDYCGKTNSIK